ncbi:MAG: PA2779 family protein [Pseudohongiellaceae bacterium]
MLRQGATRKFQAYLLIITMLGFGATAPAMADLVPTRDLVNAEQVDAKKDQLRSMFAREDVRDTLINLGVNPENALDRVDAMTDAEVASMVENIEAMPAGADALGTIAIILVIVILLDVAGVTDIFPGL